MPDHIAGVPILGVIAASGTGKTTLLRALIAHLNGTGLRIGCVKHTHHPFDIDRPGKDSYLLRKAGAEQMIVGGAGRWALMVDRAPDTDMSLVELAARFDTDNLDLILVEGFRLENIPKIEVHRTETGRELLCRTSSQIIALATNQVPPPAVGVPILPLDEVPRIAQFVLTHLARLNQGGSPQEQAPC